MRISGERETDEDVEREKERDRNSNNNTEMNERAQRVATRVNTGRVGHKPKTQTTHHTHTNTQSPNGSIFVSLLSPGSALTFTSPKKRIYTARSVVYLIT